MKTPINKLIISSFLIGASLTCGAQIINTVAGNGTGGFSGNGGSATAAELYSPTDVVLDAAGNMYISDATNNLIRKVDASGIITTFAGGGNGGLGDGGPATSAELFFPRGLAVDALGNVYVADYFDNRIRMINTSGIISTVAGNGYGAPFSGGFSGDGGAATSAELFCPEGVYVDATGNIYIADRVNGRIRMVNTSGIISTVAGNGTLGFSGDGGAATSAELYWPTGVTLDRAGNMYIADQLNNRIRMVNTSGVISTIAGTGFGAPWNGGYAGDGGAATSAELYMPSNLVVDSAGNIFVADSGNNCIRKINTSGIISTVAGDGISGYSGDGGLATLAELRGPEGVAVDHAGDIYMTDVSNNRVREVTFSQAGVTKLTKNAQVIKAYPIPANSSLTISGVTKGQLIELYTGDGKELSSSIADNSTVSFDMSANSNGIYFIRVRDTDGVIISLQKVVKAQ